MKGDKFDLEGSFDSILDYDYYQEFLPQLLREHGVPEKKIQWALWCIHGTEKGAFRRGWRDCLSRREEEMAEREWNAFERAWRKYDEEC